MIKLRRKLSKYFPKILSPIYNKLEWVYYRLRWLYLYSTTDFFESIGIEINSYCQLRCSICPNSVSEKGMKKNEVLLDIDLVLKVLNDLRKIKYRGRIVFHRFNEPLTDKRLVSFVSIARTYMPKCKINIATNGLLLTNDKYLELKEAGVNTILVTEYDLPIKKLPYKDIIYRTLNENDSLHNRSGLVKTKQRAKLPCQSAFYNSVNIDATGKVLKCCNDYFGVEPIGDIRDSDIISIWNSPLYKHHREKLKKKQFDYSELCKECVK